MAQDCFENRELSWLRFNERVLEEAEDARVPLCERLSFLSIFQTNLDEFFMVRIGSLHDEMLLNRDSRDNKTNQTPRQQLTAALGRIAELSQRRDLAYYSLLGALSEQGISMVNFRQISRQSEKALSDLFDHDFQPLLSAFMVSRKQTFPFLQNKQIYAVALLEQKAPKAIKRKTGIVPIVTSLFPRVVAVPKQPGAFILAEEIILHYLPRLFPGYRIVGKTLARITRNADIDADAIYDEDLNYREHMAEVVKRRSRLNPVRMELSRKMSDAALRELRTQLKLDKDRIFFSNSPLDYDFFSLFRDRLRNRPALFYPPRVPQSSPDLDERSPIIPQIMEKDVLLHYPYQSIRPFLQMLSEAARDPEVVSIRMTLYRLARDSKVVESLVEAAENGKQVDVLVELKARFDEENNIEWSRQLERAGCHVIYGLDQLKVHSKLCLITFRHEGEIRHVCQIGTGNYNEKTSRLYTDLSYMTADETVCRSAEAVFEALMIGQTLESSAALLVAPRFMEKPLIDLVQAEIDRQQLGGQGHIRLKMNSMTDRALMDKLIEASQAGVRIQMVVRGICCLKAGVRGKTDNIEVISIVGRFLEHSRIYIFGDGEDARYYIGSADWMTRNMSRRVEVAVQVPGKKETHVLEHIFDTLWADNLQARVMLPDGSYLRRFPEGLASLSAQEALYDEAYAQAGKPVGRV